MREKLANRRQSENRTIDHLGILIDISFGYSQDGQLREVFTSTRSKMGSVLDIMARDISVMISFLLQYGCDMKEVLDVVASNTKGEPEGLAGQLCQIILEETKDMEPAAPHVPWHEKVKAYKEAGGDMSLKSLLELSKTHTMSAAEREAQRMSWVIGEMMLDDPDMTREQAIALYQEVRSSY